MQFGAPKLIREHSTSTQWGHARSRRRKSASVRHVHNIMEQSDGFFLQPKLFSLARFILRDSPGTENANARQRGKSGQGALGRLYSCSRKRRCGSARQASRGSTGWQRSCSRERKCNSVWHVPPWNIQKLHPCSRKCKCGSMWKVSPWGTQKYYSSSRAPIASSALHSTNASMRPRAQM